MAKGWKPAATVPDALRYEVRDVPPHILQVLYNRGLRSKDAIRQYFSPADQLALHDPFALKGLDVAVARLGAASRRGERVAVYGDFDVDGLCGAALLTHALADAGLQATVYIPRRLDEGYGLNMRAIGRLAEQGVTLLIAVDCGTSSVAEVAYARERGMDVIVADHHHVPDLLPCAAAILNPHQADCPYPFKELAGVGVAYKLAEGLRARGISHASDDHYLDLVAIGTVVDVAPLVGENRVLVQRGLAALNRGPRPGLAALLEIARLRPGAIDSGCLGYAIGPRLNAAGRLDDAAASYRLLTSRSVEEARPLAQRLEEQNLERQKLTETLLARARGDVAEQAQRVPLLFVSGTEFAVGILGLVAGRLAEEFYRPAVVVEVGDDECRGSCRSIPEFHMAHALDQCRDLLLRHGGHAQAAGFTLRASRLDDLRQRLLAIAERELGDYPLEPTIRVDAAIPLALANWETLRWLKRMEPFGPGNATPIFHSSRVRVKRLLPLRNDHLRMVVTDGRVSWDAIAFRQGSRGQTLSQGDVLDVVYSLEETIWGNERTLQLVIKDMRRPGSCPFDHALG